MQLVKALGRFAAMLLSKKQELQLESIAYRQVDRQEWCKPIAFGLATISTFTCDFSVIFQGANGDNLCWDSIDLDFTEQSQSLVQQILAAEKLSLRGFEIGDEPPFEFVFLTDEQRWSVVL
jgi:hypothetical protein